VAWMHEGLHRDHRGHRRTGRRLRLILMSVYFGPIDSVDNGPIQQSTVLTVVNNETITTDIRLIKR
jgi:hypothetical protein